VDDDGLHSGGRGSCTSSHGKQSWGGRGTEQRNMCARKKKRGRGSGGPIWKSQKLQGPLGKLKFPTDVEV
jgi:hypothetical protein